MGSPDNDKDPGFDDDAIVKAGGIIWLAIIIAVSLAFCEIL